MDPDDQKRLRMNFDYIVDNLRVQDVADRLFAQGILTVDHMETLDLPTKTPRDKARYLILTLPGQGPSAYSEFIDALNKGDHPHVAQQLQSCDPRDAKDEVSPVEPDTNTETKIQLLHQKLIIQTEMILSFKQEVIDVRKEWKEKSTEDDEIKMKKRYFELEQAMKKISPDGGNVSDYLQDYFWEHKKDLSKSTSEKSKFTTWDESQIKKMTVNDQTTTLIYQLAEDTILHMKLKNAPKAQNKYIDIMRKMVHELVDKYASVFETYVKTLDVNDVNGFSTVTAVADEMFKRGENNWGRVITLYALGGFIASHARETHNKKMAQEIGQFIGWYMVKKHKTWIDENNGWDGFVEWFEDTNASPLSKWASSLLMTAVGVGAVLSIISIKSGT